jgi:hypothetical protein
MEAKAIFEIEEIKVKLIECCISCNAIDFLPFLLSPLVGVGFPNKIRFYSFLKSILKCAREESIGMLELRIEQESWEQENVKSFNFYDEAHKFPRINLKIREEKNCLIIDLMPF